MKVQVQNLCESPRIIKIRCNRRWRVNLPGGFEKKPGCVLNGCGMNYRGILDSKVASAAPGPETSALDVISNEVSANKPRRTSVPSSSEAR